jgi:hypothetical protein
MAAVGVPKRLSAQQPNADPELNDFVRPALKVTDLPITAAQQATIENLVTAFKKGGEFDVIRKDIWNQFVQSVRPHTHSLTCLV